ncbi:hypothetical protein ACFL2Q_12160, partial [Thermodesulfobacteriota bacterium]
IPYGYVVVDVTENGRVVKKLLPDAGEQEVIERARQLRRGGHTIRNIIDFLEAEGFRSRGGGRFSMAVISRIVSPGR